MQPRVFERQAGSKKHYSGNSLVALRSAGLFLSYVDENNVFNLPQFKVQCLLLIFTEICIVVAGSTVAALLAAYLCFPMKSTAIASLDKECQGWNKQLLTL